MHPLKNTTKESFKCLINNIEGLIGKIEALLAIAEVKPDWDALAWRWISQNNKGFLQAIKNSHKVDHKHICFVDIQKAEILRNTRGVRNGRVAHQFARHYAGKLGLAKLNIVKSSQAKPSFTKLS